MMDCTVAPFHKTFFGTTIQFGDGCLPCTVFSINAIQICKIEWQYDFRLWRKGPIKCIWNPFAMASHDTHAAQHFLHCSLARIHVRAGAHFIDFAGRNYMMMRASKLVFINFEFNAYGAIILMMLQKRGVAKNTLAHINNDQLVVELAKSPKIDEMQNWAIENFDFIEWWHQEIRSMHVGLQSTRIYKIQKLIRELQFCAWSKSADE